jgi:hypothetical protein
MLTGLFFLGGLVAFTYVCWWICDNERTPDGALPQRGLLAMASMDDLASEAADRKTPGWKRKRTSAAPTAKKANPSRKASYRRTGR